ncbi:MAG: carbohydrate-binding protein CenC [Clostridiaceae bacterium]|nr:carbohydrate-binding protein CenC [Clostridiaceae bacterium]
MIKKRIVSLTAVCSLLISVLISSSVPVLAKATGVPGKPLIDMSESYGQITSKLYIKSPVNNATRWRLYENNKIVQTGTATDSTPNSQTITPAVFNRPSGQYTYKCEFINEFGSTFSDAKTFTVSHGYIDPTPAGAVFTENFENGINGWTKESSQSSATGTIESGTGTKGSKCLKLSSTSVAANLLYKKTVTLTKGEKYRLTAYVKYNNVSPTYNPVGPTISIEGTSSFSGDWLNKSTSTGWEKMTLDFTAPSASTVIAVRLGYPSSEMKGVALFDNIAIEHLSKQVFTDTFENGLSSSWIFGWGAGSSNFALDTTTGYNSSKSLKVTSPNFTDFGVTREVSGFVPGAYYEISAYVKYSNVDVEITTDSEGKKHKGSDGVSVFVLYPDCDWIRSDSEPTKLKYPYTTYDPNYVPKSEPTSLTSWKQIKAIFPASPTGTLRIGLRLGHVGSRAKGTVWFDNIKVRRIDSELNIKEGNYIKTAFTPYNTETINKVKHADWISNLDQAYVLIKELVGNKVPFEGRKIGFIETKSYPGGALVAGNPILWWDNNNAIRNALKNTSTYNDIGFGPVHEIGHDFNIGNSSWNWNDEMFTNFRMYYVVDQLEKASKKLNLTSNVPTIGINNTYGQTAALDAYYKQKYNESFGLSKYNHDGLMYILIRIQKKTGWEPFYKTFKELNSSSTNYSQKSAYDRFETFITTLDKHTSVDVVNEITVAEFDVLITKMK